MDAARAINDNPAVVALYGPILDVHSLGELAMTKVTVLYAVILALMFVVIVRRHTRSEEESGHAELLAGTAIGRDALLAAALVEGVVLSFGVGALVAVADIAGGLPVAGSLGVRCDLGRDRAGRGRADGPVLPARGEQPDLLRDRRRGARRRST